MPRLRVRLLAHDRRVPELHEWPRPTLAIGRGPHAELSIADDSICRHHARLLARRGAIVLCAGRRGRVARRGERVLAPIVLAPGEPVWIGDVELSAWVSADSEPSWIGRRLASGVVRAEIPTVEGDQRRYLLAGPGRRELATLSPGAPPAEARGLPAVVEHGERDGHGFFVEALEDGLRLFELSAMLAARALVVPAETWLLVAAEVAAAAAGHLAVAGPHGAIDPAMVHVGRTGTVQLLRPGRRRGGLDDPERRPYLSLRQRCGERPTESDDVEALRALVAELAPSLRPPPEATTLASVARFFADAVARSPLDPARGHVARAVRLAGEPPPRLGTLAGLAEPSPTPMFSG